MGLRSTQRCHRVLDFTSTFLCKDGHPAAYEGKSTLIWKANLQLNNSCIYSHKQRQPLYLGSTEFDFLLTWIQQTFLRHFVIGEDLQFFYFPRLDQGAPPNGCGSWDRLQALFGTLVRISRRE